MIFTIPRRARSSSLEELWSQLEAMTAEKGLRLQEALDQQMFLHAIKDVDLWLDEVEKQLSSEELGKVSLPPFYFNYDFLSSVLRIWLGYRNCRRSWHCSRPTFLFITSRLTHSHRRPRPLNNLAILTQYPLWADRNSWWRDTKDSRDLWRGRRPD